MLNRSSNRFSTLLGAAVLGLAALMSAPVLAGDVEAGKKVFKKCKACHYAAKEKNKTGPHLVNLTGREAGSIEGFKYS